MHHEVMRFSHLQNGLTLERIPVVMDGFVSGERRAGGLTNHIKADHITNDTFVFKTTNLLSVAVQFGQIVVFF